MANENSSFLLQIYRAQEELGETCRVASRYGITLIHDGHRPTDVIDLFEARIELSAIGRCLTLGTKFKGSTGYDDYRSKGHIVIEKLCHIMATMNNGVRKFQKMGLEVDTDSFEGHYYKVMSTCGRAFQLLCGLHEDDEESMEPFDSITIDDYKHKAEEFGHMYGEYAAAVIDKMWLN